jgi:hypothetical protein
MHDIGGSESIDVMDANSENLVTAYKDSRNGGLNNWQSVQWSPGGTFIAFSADGKGQFCQRNVETFMLPFDVGSANWDGPTNFACLEGATRQFEILGADSPLDDSSVQVLWRNPGNGLWLTDSFTPGNTAGSVVPSIEAIPSHGFGFDVESLSVSPSNTWLAYNRGPGLELTFVNEFGSYGSVDDGAGPGLFNRTNDIATDSQGRLIIADRENHRIQICDYTGLCTAFGVLGAALGEFELVQRVTTDSHDHIIVSDFGPNMRIQICDDVGNCSAFGGPVQFENLNGVGVDDQDRIYVSDSTGNGIHICDHVGICSFFSFDDPHGLAVDKRPELADQQHIIVSSGGSNGGTMKISSCDKQGTCTSFGGPGDTPGLFDEPRNLAVDNTGLIYIADTINNRIQACDYQGDCLAFGSLGAKPGQFYKPVGIHPDEQGRLIVGDTFNHRVQIYNIGAEVADNSLVVRSFDANASSPDPIAGTIALELLASDIGVAEFAGVSYSDHSDTTLAFTSGSAVYCLDITDVNTPNLVKLTTNLSATTISHSATWRPDGAAMVLSATVNAGTSSEQLVVAELAFESPNSVGGCPATPSGALTVLATGEGTGVRMHPCLLTLTTGGTHRAHELHAINDD